MSINLIGPTISLEPLTQDAAQGLYQVGKNPLIWQWLPREELQSLADTKAWIEQALASTDQLPLLILTKEPRRIIGSTRLIDINSQHRTLEIGYSWLSPEFWQTRINAESKFLLLQYVFEQLQFNRAQLKTDVNNLRSQRAIEKLGAVKEGVLRSHMVVREGRRRDSVYYSILKEEWPRIKIQLMAQIFS